MMYRYDNYSKDMHAPGTEARSPLEYFRLFWTCIVLIGGIALALHFKARSKHIIPRLLGVRLSDVREVTKSTTIATLCAPCVSPVVSSRKGKMVLQHQIEQGNPTIGCI